MSAVRCMDMLLKVYMGLAVQNCSENTATPLMCLLRLACSLFFQSSLDYTVFFKSSLILPFLLYFLAYNVDRPLVFNVF